MTEGTRRIATFIELGGTDPLAANTAVVKFTVRHAGQYRIAVLIGSCHVHGSPFVKNFLPGNFFLSCFRVVDSFTLLKFQLCFKNTTI